MKYTVEQLISNLKQSDPNLRYSAIKALDAIGDKRAIRSLVETLEDDRTDISRAAALALSNIGDKQTAYQILNKLTQLNDNDEKSYKVGFNISLILGKIADQTFVDVLLSLIETKNSVVRASVAWTLGELGDIKTLDSLIKILEDKNPKVRTGAIASISLLGGEEVIELLIKTLEDDDDDKVREMAIVGLGELNSDKALRVLEWTAQNAINISNYEAYPIAWAAAKALEIIKHRRSIIG